MSYARFSADSDVYVFENTDNKLECCGCVLDRRAEFDTAFAPDGGMIAHLERHIAAGHKVPASVIPALRIDAGAPECAVHTRADVERSWAPLWGVDES